MDITGLGYGCVKMTALSGIDLRGCEMFRVVWSVSCGKHGRESKGLT